MESDYREIKQMEASIRGYEANVAERMMKEIVTNDTVSFMLSGKHKSVITWHKYPEEKPDEKGDYLITIDYKSKLSTHVELYRDRETWGFPVGFADMDKYIIAWAELPKPFKEYI